MFLNIKTMFQEGHLTINCLVISHFIEYIVIKHRKYCVFVWIENYNG